MRASGRIIGGGSTAAAPRITLNANTRHSETSHCSQKESCRAVCHDRLHPRGPLARPGLGNVKEVTHHHIYLLDIEAPRGSPPPNSRERFAAPQAQSLLTRLAGGSDLHVSGIPERTGRALVTIREKARLGLLAVWGRPNAVPGHLDFTPLESVPAEHWTLAHIDYMEYIQDTRCKTDKARHPGTSPYYADLQFDKIEVDKVFPQEAKRRLRFQMPFAWAKLK
jgi:hypothetical protein